MKTILRFIIIGVAILIGAWFSVHLLALLGVFLAIAYPFWWFLFPHQTICLNCHALREGEWCIFCHRTVSIKTGRSPADFSSVLKNATIVLVFTIISFVVVLAESAILFKLGFPPTPKTASFVIPSKGQYRLGEIFPVKVQLTGLIVPVNAVQADLGFDPQSVEVVDISTVDSFATLFVQKEINNEGGYVRLTGGLPNPGFAGSEGAFFTVYFRGITPGLTQVEFLPSSLVLANDGRGTNVLKDLWKATYLILPDRLSAEEELLQQNFFEEDSAQQVLGESTLTAQMQFYSDEPISRPRVLGAETEQEIRKRQEFQLTRFLLEILERLDRFILDTWHWMFSMFRPK